MRVEPVKVVPFLDVVHDPVGRDAFPRPTFPQDPPVVLVYGIRAEPGDDDEDPRLSIEMSSCTQGKR